MNYYERHLGDYARDTPHLTMLEHGAYTAIMDRYYATERGLPDEEIFRLTRARSKEEKAAVQTVLKEYFTLVDGLWKKGRIEEEIAKANKRILAAKSNGRKGGRPKTENPMETQQEPIGFSLGSIPETQSKALHAPCSMLQSSPPTPSGGNVVSLRPKKPKAITLKTYLAECGKSGRAPVQDGDPAFVYADKVGLPDEMIRLAWEVFAAKYVEASQKQSVDNGWPLKFKNAIEGNWGKLWWRSESGWELTTAGRQAQLAYPLEGSV